MKRLIEKIERYIETYQLPPFGKEVYGTVELLQEVSKKLAKYEDFEKIFREKMTGIACEFLSDKEEFGKWLDRNKWIAKKCDEYTRLEEQGLLLRLPCNVGDEFYVIAYSDRKVTHVKCTGYCINNDTVNNINQSYIWIDSLENLKDFWKLSFEDFKIQCFKTQAEAEQKLKEMED